MIAEIEANGKTAAIFAELARELNGKVELKKAKRSLFDPLISALGRKKARAA
jgi:hypothetical protein